MFGVETVDRTEGNLSLISDDTAGPAVIFFCTSSLTVSFIIAPQVGQIERVGAKLRWQTGQFIGLESG